LASLSASLDRRVFNLDKSVASAQQSSLRGTKEKFGQFYIRKIFLLEAQAIHLQVLQALHFPKNTSFISADKKNCCRPIEGVS
jgi:hypothetical protein